jgi:Fur family ferric uptake transcriptional regulator
VTRSGPSAPPPPNDRQEAVARLRRAGCRITPARDVLLDDVLGEHTHVTAEDLIRRHPEIDEATVYRALSQFEAVGIVHHVHLGHGPATYRRAPSTDVPVVCEVCGRVVDVPATELASLRDRLDTEHAMVLHVGHFALTARCRGCGPAAGVVTP